MRSRLPLALLALSLPWASACNLPTDWGDPADGGTYAQTRYPIVLVHGLFGFETLVGVVDYWVNIPEALAAGGADVYVVTSSLLESSEARGELIIPQIEEILAITGAEKVNLVGHSQGTLDSRYIAAVRPDLVASVTGIGGPNTGSPLADLAQIPGLGALSNVPLELLARLLILLGGPDAELDPAASMYTLSSEGAAAFNAAYPAALPVDCGEGEPLVDGIHYFSWTGIAHGTNAADVLDVLWIITGLLIADDNDGLVGRCSSHLGQVIRDDYCMNHLDEVGLMFGLVSAKEVRPEVLFRAHANRLGGLGL